MPELLAHLVGDYVLQSHVMATRKTSSLAWAFIHAAFYTLPFLLLTQSPAALAVILVTHAIIDRLAVARHFCAFYGCGGFPGLWDRALRWWDRCCHDPRCITAHVDLVPPFEPPPPFLGVWLVIIADNTMHLAINHLTLAYL
jgi:hypothetical protein